MKTVIIISVIAIVLILVYQKLNNSKTDGDNAEIENSNKNIKGTIFYHEDDFGQIEIIPNENFDELIKEARSVEDFSGKHFDGGGYTDVYVREDNGLKLEERKMQVSELNEILSKLPVDKHTIVTTGIRPDEMLSENTLGYGENYNGLFFDFKDGIVSNIWISGELNMNDEKLISVLNEIGEKWSLLLMDWNSLELIDLKNKEQIKKYIE